MPSPVSDEAIFTFSNPKDAKLLTPEDWVEWLAQEIEDFPEIPDNETHVVPLWMSFELIDNVLGDYLLTRSNPEQDLILKTYHGFMHTLFMTIGGFEVESIVGLTIKTAMMAVAHKFDYATIDGYQQILMMLLKISAKLANEHLGSTYDENGHFIPRTLH